MEGRPGPWPRWLSNHRLIESFISVDDPDLNLFVFLPNQLVRIHPVGSNSRSLHRPRLVPWHTPPSHDRHHICRYEESSSWNPKIERDRRTRGSLTDRYLSSESNGAVLSGREGAPRTPVPLCGMHLIFQALSTSQCSAGVSERGPKGPLPGGVLRAAGSSLTRHHPGFSGRDSIISGPKSSLEACHGPLAALLGRWLVSEGPG